MGIAPLPVRPEVTSEVIRCFYIGLKAQRSPTELANHLLGYYGLSLGIIACILRRGFHGLSYLPSPQRSHRYA
jgi:hypothetical protein